MTDQKELNSDIKTELQNYDTNKTVEDAFNKLSNPQPLELAEALADTTQLTEKEAIAAAYGLSGERSGITAEKIPNERRQELGFETHAELKSTWETAEQKLADAVWITELVDHYRGSSPDQCGSCEAVIEEEQPQFEVNDSDPISFCRACTEPELEATRLKAQRVAVVDELKSLLTEREEQIGHRIGRIHMNLLTAREEPLDDGEYNYCMRLALGALEHSAAEVEPEAPELAEKVNRLRDNLTEKAGLPPQDQVTRTR
jgi:hypothetical protein